MLAGCWNSSSTSVPAPDEMPAIKTTEGKELKCKTSDPASAFVFKTTIEQHLGEVSFFKVYAGEITEAMDMINPSRNSSKERLSQLFVISGKNREKVEKLVAGDIGATIKLKNTLYQQYAEFPQRILMISFEPIAYPEPKFRVAVKAKNQSDDEKLGSILSELSKMDPTLVLLYSKELKADDPDGTGRTSPEHCKMAPGEPRKRSASNSLHRKFRTVKPSPNLRNQCTATRNNRVVPASLVKCT